MPYGGKQRRANDSDDESGSDGGWKPEGLTKKAGVKRCKAPAAAAAADDEVALVHETRSALLVVRGGFKLLSPTLHLLTSPHPHLPTPFLTARQPLLAHCGGGLPPRQSLLPRTLCATCSAHVQLRRVHVP